MKLSKEQLDEFQRLLDAQPWWDRAIVRAIEYFFCAVYIAIPLGLAWCLLRVLGAV